MWPKVRWNIVCGIECAPSKNNIYSISKYLLLGN